jgi:hypothetical protein
MYGNKLIHTAFIWIIELTEPKRFGSRFMGSNSDHSEEKQAMRKLLVMLVLGAFAVAVLPTASAHASTNGAQQLVKKHHHHHCHHKKTS